MEFEVVAFWLVVVGVVSLILYLTWFIPNLKTSLPPGPPSWPIVGSLFYLSKCPHVAFTNLAKKYGPIMYLRLGFVDHIILSNSEMAMELFKVHDVEFASRPKIIIGKYLGLDWSTMFFSNYGDHWCLLRKIAATQLLTIARINSFEPRRQEELGCMVEKIIEHSQGGKPVDMRNIFRELMNNNICQMLFGTRCEITKKLTGIEFDEFFNSVSMLIDLLAGFNLGDFIPFLKPFDLQGLEKKMKCATDKMEHYVESILKEYKKGNKMVTNSNVKDFIEVLLNFDEKLDDATIKSIMVVCPYQTILFLFSAKCMQITSTYFINIVWCNFSLANEVLVGLELQDMLAAGGVATAMALEWALAEVIHNPEIMNRAQEELDRVVGTNRRVQESDLPNLPYLHAIVKETLRLHPSGALTFGHVNVKDAQLLHYKIPANTNVLVNIWAINRDPKAWKKPLEFIPDRFFNTNISVSGSNYNVLTFGSGRRRCPGMDLSQHMMYCGLATLIQAFDWSPQLGVKPKDMNMMEGNIGALVVKDDPLIVIAKPRLPPQLYNH
jgi:cytochrome P450